MSLPYTCYKQELIFLEITFKKTWILIVNDTKFENNEKLQMLM